MTRTLLPEPTSVPSMVVGPPRPPRRSATESVAIAEEVAAVLRHDLRNKFASVRNAVAYIEKSLQKMELLQRDLRILRFLKLICEQLDVADGLLDQRARHADLFSNDVEALRFDQCVLEAVARTAIPERVLLDLAVLGQSLVRGNFEELVLAVQCLLDNAVEAAAPSGKIRVEVSEDAREVLVRVSDSGRGITPDEQERAIEAFVTNKPGHAGLGLNIAARLAGLHGGRLLMGKSREYSGAEVCLVFTRAR